MTNEQRLHNIYRTFLKRCNKYCTGQEHIKRHSRLVNTIFKLAVRSKLASPRQTILIKPRFKSEISGHFNGGVS